MGNGSSGTSLWEGPASGGGSYKVVPSLSDPPAECCGSWTPDGKYYVFQSGYFAKSGIWAIRQGHHLFGGRPKPVALTEGPLSTSAPVVSRDGRRIFAIGTQRRGELVRYDSKTNEFNVYLGGISADHVEFSPDGKWIAYSTYPDGIIWRSRLDHTERLQLSPSSLTAWFPRWSPDGKHIAFIATSEGKPIKIYVVSSNGGSPQLLISDLNNQIDPNWSPDGNSLMYATEPAGSSNKPEGSRIEIMDLKSRRTSSLPGAGGLNAPRWSPDGRFVVATALTRDKWRSPGVVIFDFKTGAWTALEDDPIDNKWWSRDGKYFYFDKYANGDPAIFRIRMSDRHLERVASLQQIRRSPGVMGWWMGLTPDNSPMVLRDTSIQEIYALDWQRP